MSVRHDMTDMGRLEPCPYPSVALHDPCPPSGGRHGYMGRSERTRLTHERDMGGETWVGDRGSVASDTGGWSDVLGDQVSSPQRSPIQALSRAVGIRGHSSGYRTTRPANEPRFSSWLAPTHQSIEHRRATRGARTPARCHAWMGPTCSRTGEGRRIVIEKRISDQNEGEFSPSLTKTASAQRRRKRIRGGAPIQQTRRRKDPK